MSLTFGIFISTFIFQANKGLALEMKKNNVYVPAGVPALPPILSHSLTILSKPFLSHLSIYIYIY